MPQERIARDGAETYLSLDRRLGGGRGSFFVRAKDDELEVLGVLDGDYLLIEPVQIDSLGEGDVVVARRGERNDFLRVGRNGRGLTLQALRAGGEVTVIDEAVAIQLVGKVSALFRRLGEAARVSLTAH